MAMSSLTHFPRFFTVNEANALLPTVRPLIERVLENIRQLKRESERVVREEQLDPEAKDFMDQLRQNNEVARLVAEIKDWVEQIHTHGCICKGVEQGLIDFPCMLGAEVVFLCWKVGEPTVNHWHCVEDGFAGRRSLLDVDKTKRAEKTSYH